MDRQKLANILDDNGEGVIGRLVIERCDTAPDESFLWHVTMNDKEIFGPKESPFSILDWLLEPITLNEAAGTFSMNLAYSTLAQAARESRLEARRSGPKTWLTTRAAIEEAIEAGRLKPRK